MTRADGLPVGSVVAYRGLAIRRRGPLALPPGWRGDDGSVWAAYEVDQILVDGAGVTRVGDGRDV